MTEEPFDEILLDIEPTDAYLTRVQADISRRKAKTANTVAVILVSALVLSLPLYLVVAWSAPDKAELIQPVFDKWFAVMGPLVGTAVGAYYIASSILDRNH